MSLNLTGLRDDALKDNFQQIQDFANKLQVSANQLQACEIYVTGNVTGLKISHGLGGIPLDVIVSRMIAPSAARLTIKYSEFTKNEVVFDISGLASGETLSARLLVGTFPDMVSVGDIVRGDAETQQIRSKF